MVIGLLFGTWCVVMWIAFKFNTRIHCNEMDISGAMERCDRMSEQVASVDEIITMRVNILSNVVQRAEEKCETMNNDWLKHVDENQKRYNKLFVDLEAGRVDLTQLRNDMECYILDLRNAIKTSTCKTKPSKPVKK